MVMRKTRKVRIQIDLVIELDEPVDSIPFGTEWCDNAANAIAAEIAKKNPAVDGKGRVGPGKFNVLLDFRK